MKVMNRYHINLKDEGISNSTFEVIAPNEDIAMRELKKYLDKSGSSVLILTFEMVNILRVGLAKSDVIGTTEIKN